MVREAFVDSRRKQAGGAEARAPAVAAAVAAEISRICSVCSASPLVSAFYLNFCPCCCFFFLMVLFLTFFSIGFFFFIRQIKSHKSNPVSPPSPPFLPLSLNECNFQIMNFLPYLMPQVYLFILIKVFFGDKIFEKKTGILFLFYFILF